jgi:hypothetical protein
VGLFARTSWATATSLGASERGRASTHRSRTLESVRSRSARGYPPNSSGTDGGHRLEATTNASSARRRRAHRSTSFGSPRPSGLLSVAPRAKIACGPSTTSGTRRSRTPRRLEPRRQRSWPATVTPTSRRPRPTSTSQARCSARRPSGLSGGSGARTSTKFQYQIEHPSPAQQTDRWPSQWKKPLRCRQFLGYGAAQEFEPTQCGTATPHRFCDERLRLRFGPLRCGELR